MNVSIPIICYTDLYFKFIQKTIHPSEIVNDNFKEVSMLQIAKMIACFSLAFFMPRSWMATFPILNILVYIYYFVTSDTHSPAFPTKNPEEINQIETVFQKSRYHLLTALYDLAVISAFYYDYPRLIICVYISMENPAIKKLHDLIFKTSSFKELDESCLIAQKSKSIMNIPALLSEFILAWEALQSKDLTSSFKELDESFLMVQNSKSIK